jgi:hypothetical protein
MSSIIILVKDDVFIYYKGQKIDNRYSTRKSALASTMVFVSDERRILARCKNSKSDSKI